MAQKKFTRLFRLLLCIPREPNSIGTDRIGAILAAEGIDYTARTLQRDLEMLESLDLGLQCLRDSKPYRWRFLKTASQLMVPGLDPQAALALCLVELHLKDIVPKATLSAIKPHLQVAEKALDKKPVKKWLDKIRLIPKGQKLLAPNVDGSVLGVVHEALLEGKQLKGVYKARDKDPKEMTFHPLGLVHRESVPYLIATTFSYPDVRQYAIHRLKSAVMLDENAKTPPQFDLDAFIEKEELSFRIGDELELELLFDPKVAVSLFETPLSRQQQTTIEADGRVSIKAKVADTQALRSWILGYGSSVEVRAPASFREEIAHTLAAGAKLYS